MALKHSTVVVVADDGTSPVGTDEWNADHVIDTDGMLLDVNTNAGTTTATNKLRLRARSYANHYVAELTANSGAGAPLQEALWQNAVVQWHPTTATGGLWTGTTGGTTNGTFANLAPTFADRRTALKRSRYSNIVTTANQVLGQRNTEALWALSTNAAIGGFWYFARGGFGAWTNGGRFFAGLNSGVNTATACPVIAADPSTVGHSAGFCVDAADNGAISFLTRNGTTPTKASTGRTITSNSAYDFFIYAPPSQTANVFWMIIDLNNQTVASGTAVNNLPASGTGLMANFSATNAALTPVDSVQVEVNRIYVSSDY
jgi:hypothetical protein